MQSMDGLYPQQSAVQPAQQSAEPEWDESAFESAFEEAARELSRTEASGQLEVIAAESSTDAQLVGEPHEVQPEGVVEQQVETEENRDPADDGDALAQTAGQLLDSVKENSSAKFQQSSFLALMRKLRDHEVIVEGDTMVEVRLLACTSCSNHS